MQFFLQGRVGGPVQILNKRTRTEVRNNFHVRHRSESRLVGSHAVHPLTCRETWALRAGSGRVPGKMVDCSPHLWLSADSTFAETARHAKSMILRKAYKFRIY